MKNSMNKTDRKKIRNMINNIDENSVIEDNELGKRENEFVVCLSKEEQSVGVGTAKCYDCNIDIGTSPATEKIIVIHLKISNNQRM